MEIAALVVSLVALAVTGAVSFRQLRLTEHANTLPVLVDLFREHRSERLAQARQVVHERLPAHDLSAGLAGLPERDRDLVRELAWFYDNLGALVAHGVVDIEPVSGYLGGSVISVWESMRPLVQAERDKRAQNAMPDPNRWQEYFENLYHLVRETPADRARAATHLWRLPPAGH
ncbi:DUF4760 domain-containing protein [Streptomyces microflavus]|uniref:DUF4760 domain-containing protein n=1 Tax=Streptomyces microflavus TaxID=1919 RepID=A0A7J0CQJ7_STRMI|nr:MULTISPECIES: hypothetical protein [Streptomyces]MDX2405192.1 hypothetical protein [Streptomyces microflavus]MDX2981345.1 hypothetical protein [Streptomyces sp. NRRL_B-2249]GFN04770.1 hypothetical protein Smic_33260 [Streptomyces microflavus]